MEISGNLWTVYPGDVPAYVGRDIPGSRIFIHQITWRPDYSTVPATATDGDKVIVQDAKDRIIFDHGAVAGESQYALELDNHFPGPLYVPELDSGVLEISIL